MRVGHADGEGHMLERGGEQRPTFAQLRLGAFARRDVGANGHILARFAAIVEEWHDSGVDPIMRAVLGAVLQFAAPDPAAGEGPPQVLEKLRRMKARIDDAMIFAQQLGA